MRSLLYVLFQVRGQFANLRAYTAHSQSGPLEFLHGVSDISLSFQTIPFVSDNVRRN